MENSSAVLNDLSVRLKIPIKFTYEMIGDLIEPKFEVTCTFKDVVFKAVGNSKKMGKAAVSKIVLANLDKLDVDVTKKPKKVLSQASSSSSDSGIQLDIERKKEKKPSSKSVEKKLRTDEEFKREIHEQFQKLEPEAKWKFFMVAKKVVNQFQAVCDLKCGKTISGFGPSKKLSKFAVIKKYFCEKPQPVPTTESTNDQPTEQPSSIVIDLPNVKKESNIIEEMILAKFDEIKEHLMIRFRNFHNMAGIVLWDRLDESKNSVVTLTAGSICLPKKHHGPTGHQLHDMHAEILARRALLNYFYDELLKAKRNEQSIFLYNSFCGKFQLNPRYEFHLYINSAPCGNARMYNPPSDTEYAENQILVNELRIKLPYDSSSVSYSQADSIFSSMSCSDKIMKWNVLGVQGSLLNHFMLPIYFKSIVVASLFSEKHIQRALYGRVENKIDFQNYPEYKFNKPELFKTSNEIAREVVFSITRTIFIYNELCKEIETFDYTQCNFFRNDPPMVTPCKYSRYSLFQKFLILKNHIASDTENKYVFDFELYKTLKNQNFQYQELKAIFYETIASQGFGHWKNHCGKSVHGRNYSSNVQELLNEILESEDHLFLE